MEEKLNIVEILKDAPKGTKLYSPICGNVKLESAKNGIVIVSTDGIRRIEYEHFDRFGQWINDMFKQLSECLLFPSKENRDWSTFIAPKKHKHFEPFQEVLVRTWTVDGYVWRAALYSNYDELCNCHHLVGDIHVCEDDNIIPYEGNEDKVGKIAE